MKYSNTDIRDIGMSVRATNVLLRSGVRTVADMVECSYEDILEIRNCGVKTIAEIMGKITECRIEIMKEDLNINADKDSKNCAQNVKKAWFSPQSKDNRLYAILSLPEQHYMLVSYVKENDVLLKNADMPARARNVLKMQGYTYLSEILFPSENIFKNFHGSGAASVNGIVRMINKYLDNNKDRIVSYICGNDDAVWSDEAIKAKLLTAFNGREFDAVPVDAIIDIGAENGISEARAESIIDEMVLYGTLGTNSESQLYRLYPRFDEYVITCPRIDKRTQAALYSRYHGETLEEIGKEFGVTRERARQITTKGTGKVTAYHEAQDHTPLFAEDKYRYLYSTYSIRSIRGRIAISESTFKYFEMAGVKKGKKPIEEALTDKRISADVRALILNAMADEVVYVDGRLIKLSRSELEEEYLKQRGQSEMLFDDFADGFNKYLESLGVPDGDIYYTEENAGYRHWRLSEKNFVLWKDGSVLRYYDIAGTDFTEFLAELDLGQYKNTGFSTQVLMWKHPDLMKKYDIRDKYELHNLLRKIVPDGSYNGFHCGRMPSVSFGEFDMNEAMLELLRENAPIREMDLINIASEKYGYDARVIMANWSDVFTPYRHRGKLCMEFKTISKDRQDAFRNALTKNVYSIFEVKNMYMEMFPGADVEEINPYALKEIGFGMTSRAVYRSGKTYYKRLLEIVESGDREEIASLKLKFAGDQTLWRALRETKKTAKAC